MRHGVQKLRRESRRRPRETHQTPDTGQNTSRRGCRSGLSPCTGSTLLALYRRCRDGLRFRLPVIITTTGVVFLCRTMRGALGCHTKSSSEVASGITISRVAVPKTLHARYEHASMYG